MLMLASVGAIAQQAEPLIFNEKTHDFGAVQEKGGSVTTEFAFINNSGRAVKILDVKPSCGCTTPDWTREVIESGKTGVIKASFDPRGKAGYFNKSIAVTTDLGISIMLQIKGSVEAKPNNPYEFDVTNGAIQTKVSTLNMGKLFINQENGFKSFDFKNSGKSALTISRVNGPAYIRVEHPTTLKAGETGLLKVYYDTKAKGTYGFASDNIEIVTNDAEGPIKMFSVFATIEEYFPPLTDDVIKKAPILKIEGADIKFGEMFETGTLQREVIVRNTGKSELIFRGIQPNCSCVTAEVDKKSLMPGEAGKLKLSFNPKGRPGVQNKLITVYSTDPRNPVQRITLAGYVR